MNKILLLQTICLHNVFLQAKTCFLTNFLAFITYKNPYHRKNTKAMTTPRKPDFSCYCQIYFHSLKKSSNKRSTTSETYLRTCSPRKNSGQPAHKNCLIRIFTGLILDSQGCKVCSCEQRRHRPDCACAQSDLSLR